MTFKVGPLSAGPGEKVHGYIKVAEMPLGNVELPVTILNGKEGDKVLFVMAGIHPAEYPGIRATQIIAQDIDPSQVKGVIVILHCANPQGYNAKTAFVNPVDNLNFNRIFPGTPSFESFYGPCSISHHITYFIHEEMLKKATHFIDLHAGDLPEILPFYVGGASTGDEELDKVNHQMLRYTLAHYIEKWPRSTNTSTTGAASILGIPNVFVEAGSAGQTTLVDIKRCVDAVVNIAKYLEMITGTPVEPVNQREFSDVTVGIKARRGGFFTSHVGPGDEIAEGQLLGTITNSFGEILDEIKSPIDGLVQIIDYPAAKHTGDPLYSLKGLK